MIGPKDGYVKLSDLNGMLNTEYLAVVNAIQQTGMITKNGTVNSMNITVNYNPNHGVLGDLLESGVDKALGNYLPTGIAQQTGEFIYDVVKARGNSGSNFAMHSQGNLLSNAGIRYIGYDAFTKLNIKDDMVTFGSFGSPESYTTFDETIKGIKATYNGTSTHDYDGVGRVLGHNEGTNGVRPIHAHLTDIVNPLEWWSIASLGIGSLSTHSTYYCGETIVNGEYQFKCGN